MRLKILLLIISAAGLFLFSQKSYGLDDYYEEIILLVNQTQTIPAKMPKRVVVGNPAVADVVSVSKEDIVIIAKAKGTTNFFFIDNHGERSYKIEVYPEDLDYYDKKVQRVLKELKLDKVYTSLVKDEGKILLLGTVRNAEEKEQLQKALGEAAAKTTDLIKLEEESLVEIVVEVLELDTDAEKKLGFSLPTSITFTDVAGSVSAGVSSAKALWRASDWTRSAFTSTLDLLMKEGKARLLSRPNLVCQSGKEADLLIGGEVPIFTTQVASADVAGTEVEYKEYGIKLKISPIVLEKGRIQLSLNVEISEMGTAETIGSSTSPTAKAYPLKKRNISTQLHVKDGQMLSIGGLIKQKTEEDLQKFPWLGEVPVLGAFFRHKSMTKGGGTAARGDVELFINLTPKVIYAQQELTPQEQAVEDQKSKFVKKYDSADLPSGLQNYILGIQTKVMNHISYPAAVLGTGWEGDLVVRLYLNNAGAINNVVLAKSSGFKIFDDDAVSLVKNLSYPPFPSDVRVEELKVDIPIAYRDKQ